MGFKQFHQCVLNSLYDTRLPKLHFEDNEEELHSLASDPEWFCPFSTLCPLCIYQVLYLIGRYFMNIVQI